MGIKMYESESDDSVGLALHEARLITRSELAELLGVSAKTLSNRKALRTIPDPVTRPGSHPRWSLAEIRLWLLTPDHQGRLMCADEWNRRKQKHK